jgi:RND superfamily putative drug exporter
VQHPVFYRLGKWVYHHKVAIVLIWSLLIGVSIPLLMDVLAPFVSTGFVAEQSESVKAAAYLDKHLGFYKNRFIILYHSNQLLATSDEYKQKLKYSLAGLKKLSMKHEIIYPSMNSKQISKDKHTAYVVVFFKDNKTFTPTMLKAFRQAIKTPSGMSMNMGGEAIFVNSIEKQTQKDLYKADMVAAPASVITLIFIFGTLIAAFLPMVLGGGCALLILAILYCLGYAFSLSIFTLNIALLLGLCLSLDYAIFIIFRFREELHAKQYKIEEAVANTVATAGRSVFFSGLAVFVSLSALLFFPINILFSIGVGGLVAVLISVTMALTLLPAILALINSGVNRFAIPWVYDDAAKNEKIGLIPFWRKFAFSVIKHPVFFFLFILLFLLFLGAPFLNVRLGISDMHILPEHSESNRFLQAYEKKFDENELTPILLLVSVKQGVILSENNINRLYDLVQRLESYAAIKRVDSIVSLDSEYKKSQYQALYQLPKKAMSPAVRKMLTTTTGNKFTVVSVVSKYNSNHPKTLKLVRKLTNMDPGEGLKVRLTGTPVDNLEVMEAIAHLFPYAVAWISILTYIILFFLLRSVFLPFKAILMNILSLCASYGVLVFVFQEGHLHDFLNFTPQGMLDVSMLIIIFCALFGFSMDYEVFLLSRIKEHYEATHDNDSSIVFGIEKSSKIITSAALIVIILCGSFMFADVLMVKEFGLGIAIAIFVDAFIIRLFLVPATMSLVKRWNWYRPKWVDRVF